MKKERRPSKTMKTTSLKMPMYKNPKSKEMIVMTEEKKSNEVETKMEDGVEYVLVYDEDTATKKMLGEMRKFEVARWRYNKKNKVFDYPTAWWVPKKVLLRRGITTVMSGKGAMRRRQEKHEYRRMMGGY